MRLAKEMHMKDLLMKCPVKLNWMHESQCSTKRNVCSEKCKLDKYLYSTPGGGLDEEHFNFSHAQHALS